MKTYLPLRASVIAKYSPPTSYRAGGWLCKDSNGNGRKRYRESEFPLSVNYQEAAQLAAEKYLEDMGLNWGAFVAATFIDGVGYVFSTGV